MPSLKQYWQPWLTRRYCGLQERGRESGAESGRGKRREGLRIAGKRASHGGTYSTISSYPSAHYVSVMSYLSDLCWITSALVTLLLYTNTVPAS